MILLSRIFMLNALFTLEFLVLICSLFLLIYISRHKLNKWLRYIALSISIVIGLLIICTTVNAFISCCNKHHSDKCSVHSSYEMNSAKCGQKHHCINDKKCEKECSKKHSKKECSHEKTQKESETNDKEPQVEKDESSE